MAEKKGFFYRLTMGKDNQPDFVQSRLPGTRWAVFKDVFRMRMGALMKINLLVLLFALPALAWVFLVTTMKLMDGNLLPYSANLGIGYLPQLEIVKLGALRAFNFDMQMYVGLIPLLMIASVGLSGAFYVIKQLAWGEGISVVNHFFRGIKLNFFPFLWCALFSAVSLLLLMFNMGVYQNFEGNKVFQIIGIAMSIIQFVLLMCMMLFMTTQAVTYKLKFWQLVKNSFLFAIGLLPLTLFFIAISVLPIVIIMILPQMIQMFGFVLFAIFGFSFIILIWTVYAHWAFDKFVNDRVPGAVKNKGLYIKNEADQKADEERKKKTNNIRFNNPKKRKATKSIEEGSSYVPLEASFSRADLARLAEQKEQVKNEIDLEYIDDGSDEIFEPLDDELDFNENRDENADIIVDDADIVDIDKDTDNDSDAEDETAQEKTNK